MKAAIRAVINKRLYSRCNYIKCKQKKKVIQFTTPHQKGKENAPLSHFGGTTVSFFYYNHMNAENW